MPSASLSVHMDMDLASQIQDHVREDSTEYDSVSDFIRFASRNQLQEDMADDNGGEEA